MDSKKRRSTLKKSILAEVGQTDIGTQQKRRISFSGKRSIREFRGEEEPKTWNKTYEETSDHLNSNETSTNLCAFETTKNVRKSLIKTQENKENVDQSAIKPQIVQVHLNEHQQNHPNLSIISVLSSTKELINVSYQNENSKMYQIRNSIDITLNEREKNLQVDQIPSSNQTNLLSFSCEDHEKEAMLGEKSIHLLPELENKTASVKGNDLSDEKIVFPFNKYVFKNKLLDFAINENGTPKTPIRVSLNDSLLISSNRQISDTSINADKRKTILEAIAMHISPNKEHQADKEHDNQFSSQNVNKTQYNAVDIEKESTAFQDKINQLALDNILTCNSSESKDAKTNLFEDLDISPKKENNSVEIKTKFRPTTYFDQEIEISPQSGNSNSEEKIRIQNMKFRTAINFNKTFELSPYKEADISNKANVHADNIKSHLNKNCNHFMDIDETASVVDSNRHGATSNVLPRVNLNQPIERSPSRVNISCHRKTLNLNEDMQETPVKLPQNYVYNNNFDISGSIQKYDQKPKIIIRKICTPLVNKTKKSVSLEQKRLQRYKKQQERSFPVPVDAEYTKKADISLNFSLGSTKNMSLSPESSSPLIPLEFQGYTLKQLNDEIESGKIKVFSNAPKTPITDRKGRITASNFHSKQRKTIIFEDGDMPLSPDDTSYNNLKTDKPDTFFDFNTTQDDIIVKERKNTKYRYSQADEIMLDNTSFLTRAKLSDDTVSRNCSKGDSTQVNDFKDTLDESLAEEAVNLDKSVKDTKSCYKENNTFISMSENDKPISTLTISNIKGCNNFVNSDDTMDISIKSKKEHGKEVDNNNLHSHQYLIHENTEKATFNRNPARKTLHFNNEIPLDNTTMENKENIVEEVFTGINCINTTNKQQIGNEIETDQKNNKLEKCDLSTARKTLHFNNEIPLDSEIPLENIIKENIQTEEPFKGISFKNTTRNTLYLGNAIVTDEKSYQAEKCDLSPARKTMNFNDIIGLENITMETTRNIETEGTGTDISYGNTSKKTLYIGKEILTDQKNDQAEKCNLKQARKTLHFNNEILLDNEIPLENIIKENKENIQTLYLNNEIVTDQTKDQDEKCNDIVFQKSKESRKTLYFNNETCELEETLQSIDGKLSHSRKSVYKPQVNDTALNEDVPETANKTEYTHQTNDQLMDFDFVALDTNECHINKLSGDQTNESKERKSIYTSECMDLTMTGEELNKNKKSLYAVHVANMSMDDEQMEENTANTAKYEKSCIENLKKDEQKTLLPEENVEMSINESFKSAETFHFMEPLNAATLTLDRQISKYSGTIKEKQTIKQHNLLMTPIKSAGNNIKHPLIYMTPRLSLLEFTALEKRTKDEEEVEEEKYECINKRLSTNLTPVLPMPKKRQTLIFDDCLLDESELSQSFDRNVKQVSSKEERQCDMEQTESKEETDYANQPVTNHYKTEISGIVPNDSVLQTPPKEIKSRIPIPISSENKAKKSFSVCDRSSNKHNESDADHQLEIECDTLTESIQLIRKDTIFTHRKDTITDAKFVPASCKPSIFEGNPITISDVSEFFLSQWQSKSIIQQTEMSLPLDKTDTSILNHPENSKKIFDNHYIHLTLDDIDKTRLSLIQLSYEDSSDLEQEDNGIEKQLPPNDEVISENVKNNADSKRNVHSFKYLSNVSQVCRKCKRCQETLLNETSSSVNETFVLPELPPLPDLGLDRLRRLRKRPSIVDVIAFWQHVSLDRTIINNPNRSDEEDETEDKNSPVTKYIEKYETDMMSFEIDFLAKQQNKSPLEKLPFVLRLDSLLSTSPNCWIFDYQMQYRGILIFTHKKILTFTLSLTFDEVDPLGHDISLKSVKLEKGHVPKKNWKPIDFVLDFQLKLNLPYNLQWLCKGNNEAEILEMLQNIDRVCLDTVEMGNCLQRISFANHASIIRDECRTFVRKIIREIVDCPDSDLRYVKKTEIKVELLNLKKLSFRDIVSPQLHLFREEIHLLPTGLQFLQEFLPSPLKYLKDY